MPGIAQDDLCRTDFDDEAQIHDSDAVGQIGRAGQVVGDVDHADVVLVAQILQQIQDFGPDRYVQHRHRLIGHQVDGVQDQRTGDGDPLSLPARELLGIAIHEAGGWLQARLLERDGDHLQLFLGAARQLVNAKGLRYGTVDRLAGIQ